MSEREDPFERARLWVSANKARLVGLPEADACVAVGAAGFEVSVHRPRVQCTLVRRADHVVLILGPDDTVRDLGAAEQRLQALSAVP